MEYTVKGFENFKELKSFYPEEAKFLLATVGKGDWAHDTIYVYPSVYDFAVYKVEEGFYSGLGFNFINYKGAPDLLNYIDFEALGEDLISTVDESTVIEIGGKVFQTTYGW